MAINKPPIDTICQMVDSRYTLVVEGERMPGTTEDVLGNDVSTTPSPCPHGPRRQGT